MTSPCEPITRFYWLQLPHPSAHIGHGPFVRYVKILGCACTVNSPPSRVSNLNVHHGTCLTHVPRCILGSLTSDFLWSRWRGKRSRHSRCIHSVTYLVRGPYNEQVLWDRGCLHISKAVVDISELMIWKDIRTKTELMKLFHTIKVTHSACSFDETWGPGRPPSLDAQMAL